MAIFVYRCFLDIHIALPASFISFNSILFDVPAGSCFNIAFLIREEVFIGPFRSADCFDFPAPRRAVGCLRLPSVFINFFILNIASIVMISSHERCTDEKYG